MNWEWELGNDAGRIGISGPPPEDWPKEWGGRVKVVAVLSDWQDQMEVVAHKSEQLPEASSVEVKCSWGALLAHRGSIYGLQALWLSNVSLSASSARNLAHQLLVAAEEAEEQAGRLTEWRAV